MGSLHEDVLKRHPDSQDDDVRRLAELVRANPPRVRRVPQTRIQKYLAETCPQHFFSKKRPAWVPLAFYGAEG